MEENIKALQSGSSRLDAGDGDWSLFPDMRLPPKIKVPEFQMYDGTTDPHRHLRHYRGKMLQYWDYKEDQSRRCEYHQSTPGHTTDNCWKLRERIQQMIDDKQLRFNAVRPPNVQANPLIDHGSSSRPNINMTSVCAIGEYETEQEASAPFIIEYVPLETVVGVMGVTRSGRVYENPEAVNRGKAPTAALGIAPEATPIPYKKVTEKEVEAFIKIIKMNVDLNCIRPSKTTVRAFDGSQREVNREIDLLINVGPCSFNITFQVIDIPNAFSLLLGRSWIHLAGAVPSTLHQKLKFIVEERLITVKVLGTIRTSISTRSTPSLSSETTERSVRPTPTAWWGRSCCATTTSRVPGSKHMGKGSTAQSRSKSTRTGGDSFFTLPKTRLLRSAEASTSIVSQHIMGRSTGASQFRHSPTFFWDRSTSSEVLLTALHRIQTTHLSICQPYTPSPRRLLQGSTSAPHRRMRSSITGLQSRATRLKGLDEDDRVPEIKESLHRLENRQLTPIEPIEDVNVGTEEEPRTLKIGTSLDPIQRARMIDFLKEYQEVFAWSYADMPGLDPSIVKHFLPLDIENLPPKQQHLRRQINATLRRRSSRATYQRAMVTLFHDMMHKEIEVYVDDMIAKSKEGEDHLVNLKRLFERLKKYNLRLNPEKCTFGAKFGKLLGFVISERGIEVDSDKVKAIRELPPPSIVREKAFDDIKAYLVQLPVLVPPTPGRHLIVYLTVHRQSLGCMLGQEDESTCAEHAIYYLSKKFTEGESNYSKIEKMCYALVWVMQKLRQYTLYHTIDLLLKAYPLKYLLGSPSSMRNIAKWRCQLTEYNIEYVPCTSVKGQMYFDGVVNSTGYVIGAVLISPDGRYYPIAAKVGFPCTNNMAEYEACILGLQAAIDLKVKELETKDAKLVPYHEYLEKLAENFEKISFTYMLCIKNQFADALATFASMVSITKKNLIEPLEIEIAKGPAHCDVIETTDEQPWYEDIKNFLRTGLCPAFANCWDRKTLRRLAEHYFLSGETLYSRSFDSTLLQCIDENVAQRLMGEIHEGSC
ncbi:hypothetical protein CRG98_038730 [Punica granatum]|uniref:Reverse transcriptase/retrotransposon-derived protein RNase H-like domain-containing protein n=1 Tax=Punica granatum TaxID=22663 RepID=A0A2I0IA83_PUNGR|nr:hypothetical protein CRG98_038730 [Punica granatum]